MRYAVRHTTTFAYGKPVRESVMELRVRPRSGRTQRCLEFDLQLKPQSRLHAYVDYFGNHVHHFDILEPHDRIVVAARSVVEIAKAQAGAEAAPPGAWRALDDPRSANTYWDWLHPSHYARPTKLLREVMSRIGLRRMEDPLTTLRRLNSALHDYIGYRLDVTRVDSPIDDCLARRSGVCQDFAHVFIAAAREMGIPARYVGGYLHRETDAVGAAAPDATHAWAEGWVPGIGWIGFDPSNGIAAGPQHIRGAVGRDYRDVAPTRGTYRGKADSKLSVGVEVVELHDGNTQP